MGCLLCLCVLCVLCVCVMSHSNGYVVLHSMCVLCMCIIHIVRVVLIRLSVYVVEHSELE